MGVQFHPEFYDSSTHAEMDLDNLALKNLGRAYRGPDGRYGLQNPQDMLASRIVDHMNEGNDRLWKFLGDAGWHHWRVKQLHRELPSFSLNNLKIQKKSDVI